VCLVLGDNLFYGMGLTALFEECAKLTEGAHIFAYYVKDPTQYGVVEFTMPGGRVVSLDEKPAKPRSHFAVPGLYYYDNRVISIARDLKPSARGELEITDVNRAYLEAGTLELSVFGRGTAWLDTGSPDGMLQASNFIQTVETRQGLKIGCLEEIAYRKGFIDLVQLEAAGRALEKTEYGQYLLALAREPVWR
jgi:glucose-1-phosphate thymidylyltransferase